MNNLAVVYEAGNIVEQDGAKAVEWYTKAAEAGFTTAMSALADMYECGISGVEQDMEKANEWRAKYEEATAARAK